MGSEFSCVKGGRNHAALDDLATRTRPVPQAQKPTKARRGKSAPSSSSVGVNNSSTLKRSTLVPVGSLPRTLNQAKEATASQTISPTGSPNTIHDPSASGSKPLNIVVSKPGPARPASLPSYASQPRNSTPPNITRPHQQINSTTSTRNQPKRPNSEQRWHSGHVLNIGLWLPPLEESKGTTATKSPLPVIPKTVPATGTSAPKAAKPGPLKKFTCFPLLPVEIRLLIWRKTCQVPRVVRIEYNSPSGRCTAHHRQPPIGLHVCRESREEALKAYRLAFGTAQVYINFDVDVIFLDNGVSIQEQQLEPTTCLRQLLQHAGHDDIQSIRNLAVGCTQIALLTHMGRSSIAHTPPSYWDSHGAYFELPRFPNLKRLVYAVEIPPDSGDYRGSNSTYDRMHQYKKARIRLIFQDGCWEVWLQSAVPYVDYIRAYLGNLERVRALGWKAPELEIASLRVW